EADVGIIGLCGGGGEEEDRRGLSFFLRETHELSSDPLPLIRETDRDVRQVCAESEVGEAPRDSNEPVLVPRGHDEVRPCEHLSHRLAIVDRTTLAEAPISVDLDDG